jgi:hypothetical protein
MFNWNNLAHYGDFLAVPCFLITFIYFYQLTNKTLLENLLMIFIFITLICDIFFSVIFLNSRHSKRRVK